MILLRLELEGLPPTVNHMHINARGRRFRSQECIDYQDYVIADISRYRTNEWPFSGRVALTLIFTALDRRRWDIDNRVKAIQDCLAMVGVIKDDSQIDELFVKRLYCDKEINDMAKTFLFLRTIEEEEENWGITSILGWLKNVFTTITRTSNALKSCSKI